MNEDKQYGISKHVYQTLYALINLEAGEELAHPLWKTQDEQCYNLRGYAPLISMDELWDEAESGSGTYLLPYKNGMSDFEDSKLGVGVPVKDKAELYGQICSQLEGLVFAAHAAEPGKRTRSKMVC